MPSIFLIIFWTFVTVAYGEIRRYNFTITSRWDTRDGHGRPMYAINDQSPGPVLVAEEGDTFEIYVENQLSIETTLHWHGIYQIDQPWNDGVPGVTQYSIHPRDNYTYSFTVNQQYGSYFYHGHFGPAFADGMRGPIWIKPAAWRPRPYNMISDKIEDLEGMKDAEEDPHHIVVSDWGEEPLDMRLIEYRDTGFAPYCANTMTLNGKGRTFCHSQSVIEAAGGPGRDSLGCRIQQTGLRFSNPSICEATDSELEVVVAKPGQKWIWINFIHSGSHHEGGISIDQHSFYVVAADGEFVYPTLVQSVNINLGERISILVPLEQTPGDYAIRLSSLRPEQVIQGMGILRYGNEGNKIGPRSVPKSDPQVHLNGSLILSASRAMDEYKLRPFPPRAPPNYTNTTLKFLIEMRGHASWVLNAAAHQAFRQQIPPLLWDEQSRGPTTNGNYSNSLRNGSVVDIIFENGAGIDAMHPFHKHNNKAWIIGHGEGGFPWPDVKSAIEAGAGHYFNFIDPPLRDGCRLSGGNGAWTAIRYEITFPAVSMLHCHMIHHFASGQQVILLEGVEAMAPIPEEMRNRVHADFVPSVRYGPLE